MLPKLDLPVYDTTLPVSGLKLTFRPMLVKEEKIVLLAAESKEEKDVQKAIEQILTNCIVIGPNPNDLPLADIEYLLIQLRDKSLGGIQESRYVCNHVGEDGVACDATFKIEYNFSEMKVERPETPVPDKIELSGKMGIKLKPPSYGVLKDIFNPEPFDYKVLADVVECVYDENSIYKLSEATEKEIQEFFDSFPKKKIEEVYRYIESMPTYSIKKTHTCGKCGHVHNIEIRDLANLFT